MLIVNDDNIIGETLPISYSLTRFSEHVLYYLLKFI